jgi:hypothetical protein
MKIIPTLIVAILLGSPISAFAQEKQVAGLIEKVKICPENIIFRAKLDTGADHSSLDASDITEFKRDGEKWVRFKVVNFRGQKRTFEKRLVRYAKIKRQIRKPVERPVIRLNICLGEQFKEVEFNLTDRTGFSYKMLIGCSFMNGVCIVDPAKKFTSEPKCEASCAK